MPKVKLELETTQSTANKRPEPTTEPTPICYTTAEQAICLTKPKQPKATIGQSRLRFNIRKASAVHERDWQKGLMF